MNQLKVKVKTLTPNGERAINQMIEEKELARGVNILKRKDLTLNQKMRFLRGSKGSSMVISQFQIEILEKTPLTVNVCFNVFSGTELITLCDLKKKQSVEATLGTLGCTSVDYEVDYGI